MTTVDIALAFNRLFSRNIITIACGDDHIYRQTVKLEVPMEKGSNVFVKRDFTITETIHMLIGDLLAQFGTRISNPMNMFWKSTGKLYAANKQQRATDENCKVIVEHLREFARERKKKIESGEVDIEKFDLLNHLLSDPVAFPTVEDAVDEIIDFFSAAAETTQTVTQSLLCYLIKNKDAVDKARREFDAFFE